MKVNLIMALIFAIICCPSMYIHNVNKVKKINGTKKIKKKKKDKKIEVLEAKYLNIRYHVSEKLLLTNKMLWIYAIINTIIMVSVFLIITLIKCNFVWQILLGFVLLMGLIYSLYEILGKILIRKENEK